MSYLHQIVLLSCWFTSVMVAGTWELNPFANANLTQQQVAKVKIENEFQSTFGIFGSANNPVTYRLQKNMLNAYKQDHKLKVDLFISDTLPVFDQNQKSNIDGFVLIADPKSNALSVSTQYARLNDDEIKTLFERYETHKKQKNELYFKARQSNLQTVLSLLHKDLDEQTKTKLQKAVEAGARYVTLRLKPQTIVKLLTHHHGAISAFDQHIDFAPSATYTDPVYHENPELRDAWLERLEAYIAKTYIKSKKEDPNLSYLDWEGKGINIYYADAKCPLYEDQNRTYFGYTPLTASRYTIEAVYDDNGNLYEGNENQAHHTKVITGILSTVSPEAQLTCKNFLKVDAADYSDSNETIYDVVLPDNNSSNFIESYSLNKYNSADDNDSSRDYYPMDALFDNHAYDNERLIFVSAGNNDGNKSDENDSNPGDDVVSPGKAFNVVTVGNYQIDENGSIVLHEQSGRNNPLINGAVSYQKPEVSAPGTGYFYLLEEEENSISGIPFEYTMHYTDALTSGTSFATPFTAGVAANMMSKFATVDADEGKYYQNVYMKLPEVFKAGIISIAGDAVDVEDHVDDAERHSRVGEGGVHYEVDPLLMYLRNVDFSLRPDGRTCFETDDSIHDANASATYMQIDSYHHARAVVVWFNRVNIAHLKQMTRIPNTYTMQVLDPQGNIVAFYDYNGTYKEWADEPNQGYQVIDFDTRGRAYGRYNIRICKTDNHDNSEIKMGFALTTKAYTPPHPPAPGVMEAINAFLLLD